MLSIAVQTVPQLRLPLRALPPPLPLMKLRGPAESVPEPRAPCSLQQQTTAALK